MPQAIANGLVRGSIYALIALGYTMVYGILGMINFAHGEIYMIGSYAGIIAVAALSTLGLGGMGGPLSLAVVLVLSMAFAMLVSGSIGFTVERIAYRPIRGAPVLSPLISAIGMSIFLMHFVMVAQGKDYKQFPIPLHDKLVVTVIKIGTPSLGSWWPEGSVELTLLDLLTLAAAFGLMVGLYVFVNKTKLGTAMRAVAQDKTMAGLLGIDIDKVISVTFVTGAILAAAAGVLITIRLSQTFYTAGYIAGMMAFTSAVLGGIGNIPGAVLGGLVLGLAEDITSTYPGGSDWKVVVSFVVLLACLMFLPRGLLGERVGERA
ncbi:branched-chain amino acid ABC transporter permease [bacterium]|nr:branched-chain amino acid ABC transporter permease [bacterium]